MKILVIDNTESEDYEHTQLLVDNLAKFAPVETISYRDVPPIQILESTYDGVVFSGAPVHYSYDIIDSRLPYIEWIKLTSIPILGVCLGHQNIGRLYGAALIIEDEAEDSLQPLQIVQASPLFKGITSGDEVAAYHRGSVTVPSDFVLLASTSACRNQAMKHVSREIYSVQFHAELSEAGCSILGNFVDIAEQVSLKMTSSLVNV